MNASTGDFVLVVDPGFIPSVGFQGELASPSADSVRELVQASVAFVLAAFEVYDGPGIGSLTLQNIASQLVHTYCGSSSTARMRGRFHRTTGMPKTAI